jgi:hypothetical protein
LIARAREGQLACGRTAEFSRLLFDHAVDRYLEELAVQRPGSVRRGANRARVGKVTSPTACAHSSRERDSTKSRRTTFALTRRRDSARAEIRTRSTTK